MELKGAVAQVLGPVVDVEFDGGKLPEINEALTVELDGKKQVMEVAGKMFFFVSSDYCLDSV